MTGQSILRSRPWRNIRWGALAVLAPALWACGARKLEQPKVAPTRSFQTKFQQTVNHDVDILFMVDNSTSMAPLQKKLTDNFPVFMQVLEGLPGGLPNVHIAVVSSDMGAGQFANVPQCAVGGDRGEFQSQPRGGCVSTGLMPNQTFISHVNGQDNFTGNIEDVFSCIAALGDEGCGFEHQLASVARALGADGQAPPPQNAGFLRRGAFLSIILITNEDDCSAVPNTQMFDPSSQFVTDQWGPLASFRCNEFGHLCNGARPPRNMDVTFPTGSCVSAEDENQGLLLDIGGDNGLIARIKKLKDDPNQILVAAITGPPDPYHIILKAPKLKQDPGMWPEVDHSCTQSDGTYGDPSIRIAQWVEGFGHNGVFLQICASTFAPALRRIAEEIGTVLRPSCVDGVIAKTDSGGDNCTVTDHASNDQGMQIDTVVPPCGAANDCLADDTNASCQVCWHLVPGDAMNCPSSQIMKVERPANVPPPSSLNSTVSCALCLTGVNTAGCPCSDPNPMAPPNGCI